MADKEEKNDNNARWFKDRKFVLDKVDQIEKLWEGLDKRVKVTTFVTVALISLSVAGGLLAKVWELSSGVARIEGILMKVLAP